MIHPLDLVHRGLYSSPPPAQNAIQVNPSLLVSWWCTVFALVVILVRLCGRWIRTEKLFFEDKIMALSIIPLLARMGCVHVVLRWGTNNVIVDGLSMENIWHREVGSKLVLPARIFYAAFLWTAKWTIADFLHRIYGQMWTKKHDVGLKIIRWFLVLAFIAVVVVTLAECQPTEHYWQVVPDPGVHCREGISQLIIMGLCDILTDIALVAFPVPILLASNMPVQRKISLSFLFSLSLLLVGITTYRVFGTIERRADQQFRSLLASLEILAATGVANAIVLGSFLRDRGTKKAKYRCGSIGGETQASALDRPSIARMKKASHARGALSWGSDADLVEELGMRLGPEFRAQKSNVARPAPAALPLLPINTSYPVAQADWAFPRVETGETDDLKCARRRDESPPASPRQRSPMTPRGISFFDVGGLLDSPSHHRSHGGPSIQGRRSDVSSVVPASETNLAIQPLLRNSSPTRGRMRKGSQILLRDLSAHSEVSRNHDIQGVPLAP